MLSISLPSPLLANSSQRMLASASTHTSFESSSLCGFDSPLFTPPFCSSSGWNTMNGSEIMPTPPLRVPSVSTMKPYTTLNSYPFPNVASPFAGDYYKGPLRGCLKKSEGKPSHPVQEPKRRAPSISLALNPTIITNREEISRDSLYWVDATKSTKNRISTPYPEKAEWLGSHNSTIHNGFFLPNEL